MQTKAHKRARLGKLDETIRKTRVTRALALAAAAGSISGLLAADTRASSDTWSASPTDNNWIPPGQNWNSGPGNSPGSTSLLTDSDVGTFNSTSTQTTININSSTLDIGAITFDTNAAAYTIGAAGANAGNSLLLSSGGTIQIASTFAGTGTTETINAPLTLEPGSATTIGTYSFANNNTTASNVLSFAGNITGGTTSFTNTSDSAPDGGSIVLSLAGANTGLNTISGLISDGGAGTNVNEQGFAVQKTGAGTWYLTNNSNTYTGETEVSQGILNVSSLSNYGVASAIGARTAAAEGSDHGGIGILINGGTLQYTGSTPQSTNRQIRLGSGTNSIDASGSTSAGTLSFTYNGSNTNLFQSTTSPNLTLTGSNIGANTFALNLNMGVSLVKSGVGTWVYSGNDSSTNGITVNGGVLELTGSNSYAGALTINNAATLQLQANSANTSGGISHAAGAPSSFALSSGETLQLRSDSSVTFANTAPTSGTGSGAVLNYDVNNFGGSDTTTNQTLTAATAGFATYQTTINVTGGNGYALSLGSITNANGGYLNINANSANVTLGGIAGLGGAALTVGGSSNTTITGAVAGTTGTVTKIGSGALILDGANSYTGLTTISAGTLQLGDGTSGHDGSVQSTSITNNGLLAYDTNATQFYSGTITGSGALAKAGAGTLILSGSNSYLGGTTISAGTLRLQPAIANVTAGSQLYLNAATITGIANGGTVTTVSDLSGNARNTTAGPSGSNVTFQSAGVNGRPTLVFNGSSLLNDSLSASNSTGTIFVVDKTANLTQGSGAFYGANGQYGQEFRQGAQALQLLERGVIENANTGNVVTTSGQVVAVSFTTGANGTSFYVNGSLVTTTQDNAITTFGSGVTAQIGGSNYSGYEFYTGDISAVVVYNTQLSSTQIQATSTALNNEYFGTANTAPVLPAGTPVNITNSGAALDLDNSSQTVGSLTGVSGSLVQLGSGTLTIGGGNSTTFAGVISDSGGASTSTGGSLAITGSSTLTLTAANTYTGTTTIGAGSTLQFGSGTADGSIVSTGGVADSGTLVFNPLGSQTGTYAITGSGGVVVNATGATHGSITLSASSSYNGTTIISSGTLTLDHSGSKTGALGNTAITIASAGTLAAKGATTFGSGGITVNGGTISLADGTIASVTEGGAITFNGGTLNEDITSSGTSDTLNVTGAASISGTDTINLSGTIGAHTYTLMNAASGLGPSAFSIGTRPSGFFTLSLASSTATQEILSITGTTAAPAEYWTGAASAKNGDSANNWGFGSSLATAASNWSSNAAGTTDALQVPQSNTDVYFTASNVTYSGALSTQLDAAYSIKGITFDTSVATGATISSVGINTSGNTLTIGADGLTVGVNDNSSTTIGGSTAVLLGTSENWANNSSQSLLVSAPVTGQATTGTNTLTFNGSGSGNVTISGVISDGTLGGNLGLIVSKTGSGVLTLGASNTFTGGVTLNSGTVQLGNANALNTNVNSLVFGASSTADLQLNGNNVSVPGVTTNGGSPIIEDASANNATFTGTIASGSATFGGILRDGTGGGTLSLVKAGSGTLYLTGTSSTYTGITDFAAGITNVASLSDYGVAGSLGARTAAQDTGGGGAIGLLFEGGTLQYTGSTPQETNRQIRLFDDATNTIDASGSNSSATLTFSYNGTNTNLFESPGTRSLILTGSNTGSNTFDINLSDQGGNQTTLMKSGTGTWIDGGNNSGVVSVVVGASAGTLVLSGSNSFTGALVLHDFSTLQLQANAGNTASGISYAAGSPSSFAFSDGGGGSSATLQLRGDTSVTFANTAATSGTGSGVLTYDVNNFGGTDTTSGQTFTVGGYNTYNSTIDITGGNGYALTLGNLNNLGGNLTVNANTANLNLSAVALDGAALVVGGASNTNAMGVISNGSVTKTGTGALTLSASNTYTGNTLVTGGTLILPSTGSIVGSGLSINDNNVAGTYSGVIYTTGTIAATGDILTARGQNAGSNVTGVVYQTAGTVSEGSANDVYLALSSGTGGSTVNGTYDISGGSLTPGRQLFMGGYNASLSSNTTAALNINGGTVTATADGTLSFQNTAASGTVNLNSGGLLKSNAWNNQNTAAGGSTTLNFNGGTLQANAASTNFLDSSTTAVNVYTGGGVIDTQSNNITITQAIGSAANNGLTSVALTDSADTFAAPTSVTFTGIGSGTAPTGYTVLNSSGQVTGAVITNAGSFTGTITGATIAGANPTNVSFGSVTTAANNLGQLTKVGSGTLTLTGAGTFAGPTVISAGTLTLDHSGANSGSLASSTVTVNTGTTLNIKGASTLGGLNDSGLVGLNDGSIASVSVAGNASFTSGSLNEDVTTAGTSDALNINGTATVSGTNTINLSGAIAPNTYTLITAASGLGSGFTIGSKPSGFYTLSLTSSTSQAEILTVAGTAAAPTEYWTGVASAAGSPGDSISPDGSNNWGFGSTFSSPRSNWSTDSQGNNDAEQVPGPSTDVVFTASDATSVSGALSTQLDAAYSIKGISFDTSSVTNQTSTTGPISSVVINTNGYTLSIGTDGLTVGANDNSSTTISGTGAILLNGSQIWANNSANPLTVSAPITGQSASGTNTLSFNGSGSGNVTISGVISDGTAGGNLGLIVSKTGSGVLTLAANNTFTGGVTLNSGIVQLGNAGALNSTTPNAVTFGPGSTADLQLNGNSIAVAGLISSDASTTPIVENASATAATLTDNITAGVTYAGVLQDGVGGGTLSLRQTGAGTLTLTGASNTYSGGTTLGVAAGAAVIRAAATQALGTGTIYFDGTGNGSTARLELIGGISLNNPISLAGRNSGTVAIESISGNNTLSGTITTGSGGSSYIFQSDAGLLSLSNPTTAIAVGVSTSKTIVLQGAGNGSIAGAITGYAATGLSMNGSGVWTLNASSTYGGTSAVNSGTLRANAASSSLGTGAVTVNSGGTLGGAGTISNTSNLTVNSGGTITAGVNASTNGILTSNAQSWNGGGSYAWKISAVGAGGVNPGTGDSGMLGVDGPSAASGTEGASWDLLNITSGGLNLSSLTSANPFKIAPVGTITSGGQTYSWVIAQSTGQNSITLPTGSSVGTDLTATSGSGIFALNTSSLGDASNPGLSSSSFTLEAVNMSGTEDLVLDYSYSATPEPGTAMLVLCGVVPMLNARRRRRSKPANA